MNWVLVSLLTALATASQDAWVKHHFSRASPYEMMAYPLAYSLPLFCLAAPFVTVPPLDYVFAVAFFLSLALIMLSGFHFCGKVDLRRLTAMPGKGAVAGGLLFIHAVCHGWAISLTKAVYMIALKRVSILIGVIYGGILFHERHLAYRMMGTLMMIIGAAIISFNG